MHSGACRYTSRQSTRSVLVIHGVYWGKGSVLEAVVGEVEPDLHLGDSYMHRMEPLQYQNCTNVIDFTVVHSGTFRSCKQQMYTLP